MTYWEAFDVLIVIGLCILALRETQRR